MATCPCFWCNQTKAGLTKRPIEKHRHSSLPVDFLTWATNTKNFTAFLSINWSFSKGWALDYVPHVPSLLILFHPPPPPSLQRRFITVDGSLLKFVPHNQPFNFELTRITFIADCFDVLSLHAGQSPFPLWLCYQMTRHLYSHYF